MKNEKNKEYLKKIEKLRLKIDKIDNELLEYFSKRFDIVSEVWKLKQEYNVEALQKERWNKVLENIIKKGSKKDLNEDFVKDIWERIHKESLRIEK